MNSLSRNRTTANITVPRRAYPFAPSLSPKLEPPLFDCQTNELLHHYTTNLYAPLSRNRSPSVWQADIPQIALAHVSSFPAFSPSQLCTSPPSPHIADMSYRLSHSTRKCSSSLLRAIHEQSERRNHPCYFCVCELRCLLYDGIPRSPVF
jgi:hypothetical protein